MHDTFSPYWYARLNPLPGTDSVPTAGLHDNASSAEFNVRVLQEIFRQPTEHELGVTADQLSRSPRKSIGVIGGGIAGLVAAYELACLGHSVTVFEAADQLGGRIRTHHFNDGSHGELGAMRIPLLHGCVKHYVRDVFDIRTRPFVNVNDATYFLLRDKRVTRPYFRELLSEYALSVHDRRNVLLERLPPAEIADHMLDDATAQLRKADVLESIFKRFSFPVSRHLDAEQIQLRQLFQHGREFYPTGMNWSDEAYEYLGRASGLLWFEDGSVFQTFLQDWAIGLGGPYELEDGMDRLVVAFEDGLVGTRCAEVLRNARVSRVALRAADSRQHVEITWRRDSQDEHASFDYVICAAPAASTQRISWEPALPHTKSDALSNLHYASSAKTIIRCRRRFWELDDSIYGGGSVSDRAFQQCWYPSDNARPANTDAFKSHNGLDYLDFIGAGALGWSGYADVKQWAALDEGVSRSSGVFTAAYMWESNAKQFMSIPPGERTDYILNSLKELHPSVLADAEDIEHFSWDEHSAPGAGAFTYSGPDEMRAYQGALCQPHFRDSRSQFRLFFAGEHLSLPHAWIQDAIQSALRAVKDVLAAP